MEGRVRGPSAEGAQRLVDIFRKFLANPEGPDNFVGELTTDLSIDEETKKDPDFWPRIVLLPGDRLVLRARDPDEATRFACALTALMTSGYNVDADSWQTGPNIPAGTSHLVGFDYNPQHVRRVVAKIAYALFRIHTGMALSLESDRYTRDYVLGLTSGEKEPVWVEPHPSNITTSDKPHVIVLSPAWDRESVLIKLYGYRFRVHLGLDAVLPESAAYFCSIDGSGMRKATLYEVAEATAEFEKTDFGQDWILESLEHQNLRAKEF